MTWLIEDAQFDLVVGDGELALYGFTYRHEWLSSGEALTDEERLQIGSYPLQWEIRPKGTGRVKSYLELGGDAPLLGASTAVRIPSNAIVVLAEVGESNWKTLLHSFELFAGATYPKHYRINVPFEPLSHRLERTLALEQFLAGKIASASTEEVSAVFFFGQELDG